tara:strand:- start:113 stop:433 length:321 start_codon:yes stop_codon:yes gene_type:complete
MKKLKLIFLTIVISIGFSLQSNSKPVPESFADLAEKLMPSVVNISTSTTVVTNSNPLPFNFPEFFAFYRAMQAYEKALIGGETSLILSPDSEFFKFFGNIKPEINQ